MQNRAGARGVQETERISDMLPDQLDEEFV